MAHDLSHRTFDPGAPSSMPVVYCSVHRNSLPGKHKRVRYDSFAKVSLTRGDSTLAIELFKSLSIIGTVWK